MDEQDDLTEQDIVCLVESTRDETDGSETEEEEEESFETALL